MGSCAPAQSQVLFLVGPRYGLGAAMETEREKLVLLWTSRNIDGGCESSGSEETTRWCHRVELRVALFLRKRSAADVSLDCAAQMQ